MQARNGLYGDDGIKILRADPPMIVIEDHKGRGHRDDKGELQRARHQIRRQGKARVHGDASGYQPARWLSQHDRLRETADAMGVREVRISQQIGQHPLIESRIGFNRNHVHIAQAVSMHLRRSHDLVERRDGEFDGRLQILKESISSRLDRDGIKVELDRGGVLLVSFANEDSISSIFLFVDCRKISPGK